MFRIEFKVQHLCGGGGGLPLPLKHVYFRCVNYVCLNTTQIIFLNQFFETLLRVVKGSVVSDSLFPTSSPKVTVMEFVHHYMLIARTGRYSHNNSIPFKCMLVCTLLTVCMSFTSSLKASLIFRLSVVLFFPS